MSRFIMSRFKLLFAVVSVCCLAVSSAVAQEPLPAKSPEKNPIEVIEEQSEGNVSIQMPEDLLEQILSTPKAGPKSQGASQHRSKARAHLSGYRVQVFSDGHNPSSLQARARARGSAIAARLPKYRGQVYTYSRSPNWYTAVGNFESLGEANAALNELRRAFPAFASEMRVVKSSIVRLK